MRRRDVTSFRDKRRKGTSRLEEEFLSAVESARFRIGENKKKRGGGGGRRGEEEKRIPWKTPRNWQSNKRSQEESTAMDRFETAFSS